MLRRRELRVVAERLLHLPNPPIEISNQHPHVIHHFLEFGGRAYRLGIFSARLGIRIVHLPDDLRKLSNRIDQSVEHTAAGMPELFAHVARMNAMTQYRTALAGVRVIPVRYDDPPGRLSGGGESGLGQCHR